MKRFIVLLTAAVLTGCAMIDTSGEAAPDPRYPISRQVRYGFTLENTTGQVLPKAEFWAYAPVKLTSNQRVRKIEASHPYRLRVDKLGNQVLHFVFENIPPYGARVVTVSAKLGMSDTPNPSAENSPAFTAAERYIEADHAEIVKLGRHLAGQTRLETARNVYDWLLRNLRSELYIPDDRGALYALSHKTGDCTEFAYLFTALNRTNGVSARALGGYVYAESAILRPADYHNWAEFYADRAWHIADPQKKNFDRDRSHYIAMRIIAGAGQGDMGNSHRFHHSESGLKVTMN